MKRLLFVINPISGGIDKSNLKSELKTCCTESNVAFDLIETKGDNDHKLISERIDKTRPEAVVACGGDGTINLVAQVLLGKGISMGIIPLG